MANLADRVVPPVSATVQQLCSIIKVSVTYDTSFSVINFAANLLFSTTTTVVLNSALFTTVYKCKNQHKAGVYASLEWFDGSYLQLHKMACEGREIDSWIGK